MKKRWILSKTNLDQVAELQELLGIHPALCKLLVQKNIHSVLQAAHFFQPQLTQCHSPFLMKDMDKAVERLDQAITAGEQILLYGDYDVDGTTAVALLHAFLSKHTDQLDFYIPDRYKEGYGISMAGIDYARQNGVQLMISLDCGIKAVQQIAEAKKHGIEVIICDHHLPAEKLPEAWAILDPKQADCPYPFKELCGAGVAFKFAQAYALSQGFAEEETESLLDLLAIATACDIVPLLGENRIFTQMGLERIDQNPRMGIAALLLQSKKTAPLTISDLVFGPGPIINAAGRLTDGKQAVRLLLAEERRLAQNLAQDLGKSNELRKEFDRKMLREASELLEQAENWEQQKSIVLYQSHWHKGVVGIVASRMVDAYHKPSIILTASGDTIVGSARSVPGFDVHQAIEQCEDLLMNFGGHRYAAGLTLAPGNLEAFQDKFEKVVRENIETSSLFAEIHLAAELQLSSISSRFWSQLQKFAPFGPSNRNPVFLSRAVVDAGNARVLKDKHLKLQIQQNDSIPMSAIAFGLAEKMDLVQEGPFDICYTIEENTWMGKTNLQLNVKGIREASI